MEVSCSYGWYWRWVRPRVVSPYPRVDPQSPVHQPRSAELTDLQPTGWRLGSTMEFRPCFLLLLFNVFTNWLQLFAWSFQAFQLKRQFLSIWLIFVNMRKGTPGHLIMGGGLEKRKKKVETIQFKCSKSYRRKTGPRGV